jgi:DNA-binding NtrC family response regulator
MCRVLVIDDEESVRSAVRRRLERYGAVVDVAESAEDGVRRITEDDRPYDVIVTDMSMEDPSAGLRVLSAAFARDLFAEVIVMTAYGNVANAVECMRRGAFDYIEKNSPGMDVYEMLTIKVDQAMDRRRQDMRTIQKWERAARAKERT